MTQLDHVAIAMPDVSEALFTLVGELGAPVLFGGANFGFRAMQVDAGDLRIELMEPHGTEHNDFLQRFLAANGPGFHHLTFKTPDIRALLERLESAGYTPVGVNIDNPFWKEAFVHPKQAGGTVVQVAEAAFDPLETDLVDFTKEAPEFGPGRWWPQPPEPATERAHLRRVVVTTEEVGRALGLYRDLLGGTPGPHGEGWIELEWADSRRIRLEHAAGRAPGIDRLEWTHDGPPMQLRVAGAHFVFETA